MTFYKRRYPTPFHTLSDLISFLVVSFVFFPLQNNMNAESGANGPVNQNATPPKHPSDVLEALIAAVFLDCSCDMRCVLRFA